MFRLALKLEYNGAKFSGSQSQLGVRTVQDELEKTLAVLAKQPVSTVFAGRTDAGVHAGAQVVHLDWPRVPSEAELYKTCSSLNGMLPDDISVAQVQHVPSDFHARNSALTRHYIYRILNRAQRSALFKGTHYFISLPLDFEVMKNASHCLLGAHDFAAFRSSNPNDRSTMCNVTRAEFLNLGDGALEFRISADRFVYNMVRIIVGTLVEIGLSKRPAQNLVDALTKKDRSLAGPTIPAWGLCLTSIDYPERYRLFVEQANPTRQLVIL